MRERGSSFLRENAFLVAAVALPAVVVVLFLLASAIPRWTIPGPTYDLLVRAGGPYDQALPRVAVDFSVRDGHVEATVRPLKNDAFPQLASLFLIDHTTFNVQEITFEMPKDLKEGDASKTIALDMPGGRRVTPGSQMPDGYTLDTRSQHGGGLVGDIFGMNRYQQDTVLVKNGRVIVITLPSPYRYQSPVTAVGWLERSPGS
jgi:hypothetical protein